MNALEYAGLLAINSVEFPGSMRSRRAFFCKDHQLTLDVYDGDTSADGLVALFSMAETGRAVIGLSIGL